MKKREDMKDLGFFKGYFFLNMTLISGKLLVLNENITLIF